MLASLVAVGAVWIVMRVMRMEIFAPQVVDSRPNPFHLAIGIRCYEQGKARIGNPQMSIPHQNPVLHPECRKWVADAGAKPGFGRRPNVMSLGPAGRHKRMRLGRHDLGLSMRCLIENDNQYNNRSAMLPETTLLFWLITNRQNGQDKISLT
ncbi:hypothetical protein LZ31DRAFT_553484 [Colletotrichum somersetense]|nr:hypothetical protein LZ31DRAFT_553484 [Colletotrichum somersetense]